MLDLATLFSSLSLLLAGAAPAAVQQQQPPVQPVVALSVKGYGWGHGVGLSQWGAYGFAQHGSTYDQILAHYYRGTELGKAPGPNQMRVLLVGGATGVQIASQSPFSVKDADGQSYDLPAGALTLGSPLRVKVKVDPDKPARQIGGPLVFTGGATPLAVNGKHYRGSFEVAVVSGRVRVVNVLGLDAYLLGVVPSRGSQLVAGGGAEGAGRRSPLVRARDPQARRRVRHLRGHAQPGLRRRWTRKGRRRPPPSRRRRRQVVLYGGKVATTYFFSTSGGRTASIEDAWPGSQPVPYLVSVPDPYDTASPYHSWGPTRSRRSG